MEHSGRVVGGAGGVLVAPAFRRGHEFGGRPYRHGEGQDPLERGEEGEDVHPVGDAVRGPGRRGLFGEGGERRHLPAHPVDGFGRDAQVGARGASRMGFARQRTAQRMGARTALTTLAAA
ncbi:hypothetical protein BLA24_10075 [Streptomyces cinnamoneus]|uniref:Uncharacterized protein n=1 Tax=Streptomyces cinnamoneus TaxID=53446 RepID=A0A2G1XLA8_STRCJ|nr:hypothetical protein BLA24_10075 [Streptomyces cinnamoneus]